jgi:alpha-N-acetylgalactosaminidase
LKVDGCGDNSYYPEGYMAMGKALENSGRAIEYSCSWPAYIGDDESVKPFGTFINDGCNGWRNWDDIQCSWGSLSSIIDHWGDWGSVLAPWAGPGHWHDADMVRLSSPSRLPLLAHQCSPTFPPPPPSPAAHWQHLHDP